MDLAISLLLMQLIDLSSRRIEPDFGAKSLQKVFSIVDLPLPFEPRMTLILFSGIFIFTEFNMISSPYPATKFSALREWAFTKLRLLYFV